MDKNNLTKVALRYGALFLDLDRNAINLNSRTSIPVLAFTKRLREHGFCLEEELLHAVNTLSTDELLEITDCIKDVMGVELNWTPLVKGWQVPTGETLFDHIYTWLANYIFNSKVVRGSQLPCGHLIPEGSFPLERYNGCPFCGKPFNISNIIYMGQGSKLKTLSLFTNDDLERVFHSLLTSNTPLDATQKESLTQLLKHFPVPEKIDIKMKETAMLVVKTWIEEGKADKATTILKYPSDVLRYLWFEKTGFVQIIKPKTLIAHTNRIYRTMWSNLNEVRPSAEKMKQKLMLKYNRTTCRMVANWINQIKATPQQAGENMNAHRGMWVRMIRALRLAEYSKKRGFEHLANILDVFYNHSYTTWQGQIDKARIKNDADLMLELLKGRPGLFARCLFSTMLRFGSDRVLKVFDSVTDELPTRLLLSLGNVAQRYFNPEMNRYVHPTSWISKVVPPHRLLKLYDEAMLNEMIAEVQKLYMAAMTRRFAKQKTDAKTIFIDPLLADIPISVGDRSSSIQDLSCALIGSRFKVEGDNVRLFMQWGKGLHAQHLDMDLSCLIALPNNKSAECAFYNLTCKGAKHSGDIRHIPEMVGTAEYIELSLNELEQVGATYAAFICNAYSQGSLSPNLVVGWMNSAYPMKISEKSGVAYDPSCVQHMVRISQNDLTKGLVFGVLDIQQREIIWLELPFTAMTMRGTSMDNILTVLHGLSTKTTLSELLILKAKAQGLQVVDNKDDADEVYTYQWALNAAAVSSLLYL